MSIPNMDPVKAKTSEIALRLNHLPVTDGLITPNADPNITILNELMAKRMVASQIKSFGEKMYKDTTDNIEYAAMSCGFDINVPSGTSAVIHNNGILKLEKSVRNPCQKVDIDQLFNHLIQAGVSENLLQEAKTAASSYRKPAVFLTVKSSKN